MCLSFRSWLAYSIVLGTKTSGIIISTRQVLYHWTLFPASPPNLLWDRVFPKFPRLSLNLLFFYISPRKQLRPQPGLCHQRNPFFTTSQALWSHELTVSAVVWGSVRKCSQIKGLVVSLQYFNTVEAFRPSRRKFWKRYWDPRLSFSLSLSFLTTMMCTGLLCFVLPPSHTMLPTAQHNRTECP